MLRGEKSRFQIFGTSRAAYNLRSHRICLAGDSVNTASRMESTGLPGRIQVSDATANELRLKGKERWLNPREDLVHAKGKGQMQTYWLNFRRDLASASSSTCASSRSLSNDTMMCCSDDGSVASEDGDEKEAASLVSI